jgi:asparagine synthase (glutamine-hydrolysing)
MCGISGFITGEKFNENDKASMLEALECRQSHRGPDLEVSRQINENCYFIHNLLSILGNPAESSQPIVSWDQKTSLVFNGEIYNWYELCDLLPNGIDIRSKGSDSRLLVEGINYFGLENFIRKIRGMFAFAVHYQGAYYLVRDRFGQKPLKYAVAHNVVIFASEIAPVARGIAAVGMPLTLNTLGLEHFVASGYFQNGHTFLHEVRSLKPGKILKITPTVETFLIDESTYFQPSSIPKSTSKDLKETIVEAIQEQLRADVPVGIFMSGGVDSTLLTAIAVKECGFDGPVISISFPSQQNLDESLVAREIATKIGVELQVIEMNAKDAVSEINRMEELEMEPLGDPSILPTMFLSRKMADVARVSFSGDGADELFFGYTRYKNTYDQISRFQERRLFAKFLPNLGFRQKTLKEVYFSNQFPGDSWWEIYSNPEATLARAIKQWWKVGDSQNCTILREQDLNSYLPENILVKLDRSTMAYSLEARLPFLDERLASLALKSDYLGAVQSGKTKAELKLLLGQYVPTEFVELPKKGFTPPYENWLRNELREWAERIFVDTDWSEVGIDTLQILSKWETFTSNEKTDGFRIWTFLQVGRAIALKEKWSNGVN